VQLLPPDWEQVRKDAGAQREKRHVVTEHFVSSFVSIRLDSMEETGENNEEENQKKRENV